MSDDGSEDATAAIVGSFAEDAGVRLVQCAGRTCAAARNVGAAASSGRVLCFVDADTIVPETAVDRILELHEDDGGAWSSIDSLARARDPRPALVGFLGSGAAPPAGEGEVDAGIHEL